MSEPKDIKEFEARYLSNTIISGVGIESTTMHQACPFCGAAGFIEYRTLEVETAFARDTKCKDCGRSARVITENYGNARVMEIVQTGGPVQPDWLQPKMRVMQ